MWDRFFEEVDDKYLRCLECGEDSNRLIARSGNTSNLKRHVVRFHPDEYNDYVTSMTPTPRQPRLRSPQKSSTMTALAYTCRACLVVDKTGVFTSLLEEPLKSMYFECTSVEAQEDDEMATVICSLCVARCDSAKTFRDMVLKNEELQLEQYKERVNSAPVETMTVLVKEISTTDGDIEITIPGEETEQEVCYVQSITYVDEQAVRMGTEDLAEDECYVEESVEVNPEGGTGVVLPPPGTTTPKYQSRTPESCQFCHQKFTNRTGLMTHYQEVHPDGVYACKQCDKSFVCAQTWRKHYCPANQPQHRCTVCDKVFNRRDRLQTHLDEHLGKVTIYSCHICSREFKHRANLEKHIKRHSGLKNFVCATCGASFKENRELARHTALVHKKIRPYDCTECPMAFGFRYMLDRHMRVHTGVKLFQCPYEKCGQRLSSANALKHHIYTHTGEKPYTCDKCDAAYRLKVTLNQHIKDFH